MVVTLYDLGMVALRLGVLIMAGEPLGWVGIGI